MFTVISLMYSFICVLEHCRCAGPISIRRPEPEFAALQQADSTRLRCCQSLYDLGRQIQVENHCVPVCPFNQTFLDFSSSSFDRL
jgi:hypothetical protein